MSGTWRARYKTTHMTVIETRHCDILIEAKGVRSAHPRLPTDIRLQKTHGRGVQREGEGEVKALATQMQVAKHAERIGCSGIEADGLLENRLGLIVRQKQAKKPFLPIRSTQRPRQRHNRARFARFLSHKGFA